MDLHLGEGGLLSVRAGIQAGGGQPLTRLLQRVVPPLRRGPGIFRAAPLGQRVQDHRQAGRALRRQIPLQPPRPADRGFQPHRPVTEPAIIAVGGGAGAFDHLPRQHRQIMQVGATQRGREQDLIRIRPQILRQLAGPVADLPRPRRRDLPGRQRGRDDGVGGQPPGPPEGAARRPRGDLRERPQPGPGAVVPIGLIAVLGTERSQNPRPRRRVLRLRLLQPHQRLGLGGGPQIGGVTPGQVPQPGRHHRQRLHRTRRHRGLVQSAHGRDHLLGQERPANKGQQELETTTRACLARQDTSLGSNPRPAQRGPGGAAARNVGCLHRSHAGHRLASRINLPRRHVHGVFRSLVRY